MAFCKCEIQDLLIIAVLIMWNMANSKWLSVFLGWHDITYYKDLARSFTANIALRFALQTGLKSFYFTLHWLNTFSRFNTMTFQSTTDFFIFCNIYHLPQKIHLRLSLLWHFSSSKSHFFPKWNDCISSMGTWNTSYYISLTFLIYSFPYHMLIYHSM